MADSKGLISGASAGISGTLIRVGVVGAVVVFVAAEVAILYLTGNLDKVAAQLAEDAALLAVILILLSAVVASVYISVRQTIESFHARFDSIDASRAKKSLRTRRDYNYQKCVVWAVALVAIVLEFVLLHFTGGLSPLLNQIVEYGSLALLALALLAGMLGWAGSFVYPEVHALEERFEELEGYLTGVITDVEGACTKPAQCSFLKCS